jgi:hypothetical protein
MSITAFVPSTDWQDVPDGVVLPNGGEYRMHFDTGVNQVRWNPPVPPASAVIDNRSLPGGNGQCAPPPVTPNQQSAPPPTSTNPSYVQPAISFPPLITGSEIRKNHLKLPPSIIHGLLSRGEKAEIAGGSKSFKTYALIDQALSCAAGIDWWGFKTEKTPVIYLNLEIPRAYFEQRVRDVAQARGIVVPDTFNAWHLRGQKLYDPERWIEFLKYLKTATGDFQNPLITSDPIYKLLGGRNENAAGDVQTLLEQLEDLVQLVDGANSFGHHYTKGNQSAKEAIDRASGSGVFQRDPDTLLPMTKHEKDDAFVIEPTLRNHPPVKPFVVEWKYPLFVRNSSLDPDALRRPSRPGAQSKYQVEQLADLLANDELTTNEFRLRVMNETGMSKTTFFELLAKALKGNLIWKAKMSNKWERIQTP